MGLKSKRNQLNIGTDYDLYRGSQKYADLLDLLTFTVLKSGRKIKSLDTVASNSKTKHVVLCSRLNRSAKYHLEQDLKEKFEAQCIDNSCALMTTHSINNPQWSKNTETALLR